MNQQPVKKKHKHKKHKNQETEPKTQIDSTTGKNHHNCLKKKVLHEWEMNSTLLCHIHVLNDMHLHAF
jgi:hypothetical protein